MKKLLVSLVFFFSLISVFGQLDFSKYSAVNGYGFRYKRNASDSVSLIPLSSSPHIPYRPGGIRYNVSDSTLEMWTGYQWNKAATGKKINDSTFVIGCCDTITIRSQLIDVDVLGMFGQSNMKGFNTDGITDTVQVISGTAFQFYQGFIKIANDPIGDAQNSSMGPAFARQYYALTSRRICLVPAAFEGSSQTVAADDGHGNWDTTGNRFDTSVARLLAAMTALRAAGYNPILKGILWCQGETDAIGINASLTTQAAYEAAFRKMLKRYRDTFGPQLRVCVVRIATETVGGVFNSTKDIGYSQIRAGSENVATGDSMTSIVYFNAFDFPGRALFSDQYHWKQKGYNEAGYMSANNFVSGNLGIQTQAGNKYVPTGNFGIGIGMPTYKIHVVGTSNTAVTGQFIGRFGFNRATPLYNIDVADSVRFRTLVINNLGFGGGTSLYTPTFLTFENGLNIVIMQSTTTGIPELRMSLKASSTPGTTSGVMSFFNFAAGNAGNPRQNGVITTSGFATDVNGTAGNLDWVPGTNFSNNRSLVQYTNDSIRAFLREAGVGEFWVNSRASFEGRVKIKSAASASPLDSVAMIAGDGTISKKNLADFATAGPPILAKYGVGVGNNSNQLSGNDTLRYVDTTKILYGSRAKMQRSMQIGDSVFNVRSLLTSVFYGDSKTQGTIYPVWLRWSTRVSTGLNNLEVNRGIGGTSLSQVSVGDSSFEDRIYTYPVYNGSIHNMFFIAYGVNDCGNASIDSNEFRASYQRVIDSLVIGRGWPANKIMAVGQSKVFTANVLANERDTMFLRITKEVAVEKGTLFASPYQLQVAVGAYNLVQEIDHVHDNEFGHEVVASVVLDSLHSRHASARVTGWFQSGPQVIRSQGDNIPQITLLDTAQNPAGDIRAYYGQGVYNGSIGFGQYTLPVNTTGTNNFAFGQESLKKNTTGSHNIAMGRYTLAENVSNSFNTAIGGDALKLNTANNNTGVGYSALNFNTTGAGNSAFGASALLNNSTASNNTGMGFESLFTNTTGANNTAVGTKAMRGTTLGGNNTAVGNSVLITQTSGGNNTAIGNGAFLLNSTGSFNVGIGSNAFTNATGNNNTGAGYQVLDSVTTGTNNAAFGTRAGHNLGGAGSNNAFFGGFAGLNLRSGSNNIIISSSYLLPTNSNFGKRIYIAQDNDSVTIFSDTLLNVAIGDTVAGAKLDVNGNLKIRSIGAGISGVDSPLVSQNGIVKKTAPIISGSFSQVGAATTVFTVTIGATQANTTYKTIVTPTNILSAALFYVTNKTTTTFDVTYLAGLTGTVTFDWVVHP